MMKRYLKALLILLSGVGVQAQDLGSIKNQKPLTISGQIGTSNTFVFSDRNLTNRDPIANQVFANINFALYGFDIPFSFYYTNRNTAFSHPFINMGISPRYKALKVHLGYRNMKFSSLTYNGLTFLGGGLEINNKWLRLGMFKGTLNQANAEDLEDQNSRHPSFKRPAWGVKVGFGNTKHYLDFILFSAKDDTASIPVPAKYRITPQENVVFGSNFKVTPFKFFSLSAEVGASAYNYNMTSSEIENEYIKTFDQFFIPRYNTALRYAGIFRASLSPGKWNTSAMYKYVQPDYVSLGTPYMANNYRNLSWNFNTNLLKNRIILNVMTGYQRDNITRRQIYTNQIYNYSGSLVLQISESFRLHSTYTGYQMKQSDGTLVVNESLRLDRMMHNLSLNPDYQFKRGENQHQIGLMLNYTQTLNRNTLRTDFSDFLQMAAGVNYRYSLKGPAISLNASYQYQKSEAEFYAIQSHTLGGGIEKRFFKDQRLRLQGNSSVGFNQVGNLSNNLLFNLQASGSYTHQKNHMLSLRVGFNYSKNRQSNGISLISGNETISTLNYTYRFTPKAKKTAN